MQKRTIKTKILVFIYFYIELKANHLVDIFKYNETLKSFILRNRVVAPVSVQHRFTVPFGIKNR